MVFGFHCDGRDMVTLGCMVAWVCWERRMEVHGSWGFGGEERLPALPSRGGGGEVI